jgi:signal transduction histidine kinase/CheY-like chemotaxis protein/ligand-binding sensor domain-containing protein
LRSTFLNNILPVLVGLIALIYSNETIAQKSNAGQYKVKFYTEENGLQNELVKSVAVDSLGFIWTGTDFGLIRFNGKEFTDFSGLVESNYIKSVFLSSSGRLFVTSDLAFEEILYDRNKVTVQTIAKGSKLETDSLLWYPKQIYEDRNNNIWFSDNLAVYKYANNRLKRYYLGPENVTESFVHSFSFFEFGPDFLYMVSYTGNFYRYDSETDDIIPVNTTARLNYITGVQVVNNRHDQILIGHNDVLGLIKFNEEGNFINHQVIDNQLNASSFYPVSEESAYVGTWNQGLWTARFTGGNVELDKFQEITSYGAINQIVSYNSEYILGTDYGIAVISNKSFLAPYQEITNRFIQDVEIGPSGSIYFADGNNIFRVGNSTPVPQNIFKAGDYLILQVLPQSNGIWFSDNEGYLRRLANGRITQTIDLTNYGGAIYDLIADKKGNLWLCMDDLMGVIQIDQNNKITHFGEEYGLTMQINFIKSYFIDSPKGSTERLVLGTNEANKYLLYFNEERRTFVNMELPLTAFDQNATFSINDLVIDKNQVLWMATNQGVFMRRGNEMNKVNLEFQTNRDIKAITLDNQSNVWLASSTGVSKYDGANVIPFDHLDVLPSKTISYRALKVDRENRVWAGTIAGIAYNLNNAKPKVTSKPFFLSITERGIPVEFPYKQNFNNLTYLGFSFVSPEYPTDGIQYMVKMVNKDDSWTLLNAKSEIFYTNLDKGNYQFLVRARQRGNYLWSEPLVFDFQIHKVWYQNWLYWLGLLAFLGLLFFQLTKWRNIRLEKEKIKLNNQVRERTMKLENTTAEIEAKNKQLLKAKEDAERSSRAKADFLSTMSHEIRTPLNGVLGMINILLLENPREDQLDKINTMKFSAENLLALINDILDFNKIDEGKLDLENIRFNLKELVNNVKSGFMPTAASKSIGLYLDIKKNVPDIVHGDPTRLAQLLTNLLGNAVKFTEKGEVKLVLESRELRDNSCEVIFRIIDTGIGISPDQMQNIFESFSQASSDTTRKFGGSGLGLAITKKLLELMGSRIQVRSKQSVGSEFSFKLIFNDVEEAIPEKPKEEVIPPRRLGGLRILLVEDNMINTKIAKQILEKWEIEVETAEDGQIAIDKFVPGKYDLILMDLHMPNVDGFAATRAIRERDTNIPIVALTAAVKVQDKDKVLEAGMNEFVSKPFKPKELHELIKSLTGQSAETKNQALRAPEPAKRPQFESLKGYRVLLVEDNDINIKIAKQFLEKWDLEVEVAKDGQIAVDMFVPDKYHLILMDLHLPNLDGYEATKLIREKDKNIPIIALTAAAMVQEREKVLSEGMNDFITKPFKPKDLYNKITNSVLNATLNEG